MKAGESYIVYAVISAEILVSLFRVMSYALITPVLLINQDINKQNEEKETRGFGIATLKQLLILETLGMPN